jgi:hypothetical protein
MLPFVVPLFRTWNFEQGGMLPSNVSFWFLCSALALFWCRIWSIFLCKIKFHI